MRIIVEEGIENFTTKNLAMKMGISEAALYKHFKSKEEIMLFALDYFKDIARDVLKLSNNFENSLKKLKFIFETRAKNFNKNPGFLVLILSEEIFPYNNIITEKIKEIMFINKENIEKIIKEGQEKGEIRKDIDKEALFYIIVGSFRFMITRWRLLNLEFDLLKMFNNLWQGLEKMLQED